MNWPLSSSFLVCLTLTNPGHETTRSTFVKETRDRIASRGTLTCMRLRLKPLLQTIYRIVTCRRLRLKPLLQTIYRILTCRRLRLKPLLQTMYRILTCRRLRLKPLLQAIYRMKLMEKLSCSAVCAMFLKGIKGKESRFFLL